MELERKRFLCLEILRHLSNNQNNSSLQVHGKWNGWTSWTACGALCQEDGFVYRNRTCTEPSHGGDKCLKADNSRGLLEQSDKFCANDEPCIPGLVFRYMLIFATFH